jgi:hypothetical protein
MIDAVYHGCGIADLQAFDRTSKRGPFTLQSGQRVKCPIKKVSLLSARASRVVYVYVYAYGVIDVFFYS